MDIRSKDRITQLIGKYLICMVDTNYIDYLEQIIPPKRFPEKYSQYVRSCAKDESLVISKVNDLPEDERTLFYDILDKIGESFDIIPVDVEKLEDIIDA